MSKSNTKPAQWDIHPTVNNSLSPLCVLPSGPDASAVDLRTAARDSLSRASQVLAEIADSMMDNEQYGRRLLLQTITGALFHASELLDRAEDQEREIAIAMTAEELAALKEDAERNGTTPEDHASTLIMQQLAAMARRGWSREEA